MDTDREGSGVASRRVDVSGDAFGTKHKRLDSKSLNANGGKVSVASIGHLADHFVDGQTTNEIVHTLFEGERGILSREEWNQRRIPGRGSRT